MPPAEAEYLRAVELGGIGCRPYTNIRLRMLSYGVTMPPYNDLAAYEKEALYPALPFFNGWRAQLPTIMKVSSF